MRDTNGELRLQTLIAVSSEKPFLRLQCILRHITWKLNSGHTWNVQHIIRLLYIIRDIFVWFRVALDIRLESYGRRHASVVLWYDIVCVHSSPYIHRYLLRNYAWRQNSRTLWLHTTDQTTTLLPTMHLFITTKLASTTTRKLVADAVVKITMRRTTVPLYEFVVKQPKKILN